MVFLFWGQVPAQMMHRRRQTQTEAMRETNAHAHSRTEAMRTDAHERQCTRGNARETQTHTRAHAGTVQAEAACDLGR
jgi:hypothetical protein